MFECVSPLLHSLLTPGRRRICPNITTCKRRRSTWKCYNIVRWCVTYGDSGTDKVHRSPNNTAAWRILIVTTVIRKILDVFPSSLRPPMPQERPDVGTGEITFRQCSTALLSMLSEDYVFWCSHYQQKKCSSLLSLPLIHEYNCSSRAWTSSVLSPLRIEKCLHSGQINK